MREIKFRAWDTAEKRWVVFPGADSVEIVGDKTYTTIRHDGVVIQQYTGLKDKNGKEIYEGDIVRICYPFKERTWIGPVVWDKYQWTGEGFYFSHFDSPGALFSEGTDYIEAIGNIYENPELLEKK